ncbi:hypothetical protein EDC04DRAFT_2664476 [Pisolithus marmoratus]|nr:hypothetical protein EDC04DRAFT_2664476 [Pisolithus marmoratus]
MKTGRLCQSETVDVRRFLSFDSVSFALSFSILQRPNGEKVSFVSAMLVYARLTGCEYSCTPLYARYPSAATASTTHFFGPSTPSLHFKFTGIVQSAPTTDSISIPSPSISDTAPFMSSGVHALAIHAFQDCVCNVSHPCHSHYHSGRLHMRSHSNHRRTMIPVSSPSLIHPVPSLFLERPIVFPTSSRGPKEMPQWLSEG